MAKKAVTAQAVSAEAVLELLDAVLVLATIVVESEDPRGATGAIGNHEAQIGSGCGVLGLVADAALARPPVECWRGIRPSQAANSRLLRKAAPLPMAATVAVKTSGPTPGICRKR